MKYIKTTDCEHGTWENDWYTCPECGYGCIDIIHKYCPMCGEPLGFVDEEEADHETD